MTYDEWLLALYNGEDSLTNLPEEDPENPSSPQDDTPWNVIQDLRLT